jgi:hypothetical protein
MRNGGSIISLVRDLKVEAKRFAREEAQLAKAEISEKVADLAGDSVSVAIGGLAAYAGLLVFLAGLGALVAFGFQRAGLDPLLAAFLGFGSVGLVVLVAGALLLLAGLNKAKKRSLAPERAIMALRHLRGGEEAELAAEVREDEPKEKRSSEEIETSVRQAETEMAATLQELQERLTLRGMRRNAARGVREHPFRWGLVAAGCGVAGSLWLKRRFRVR